MLIWFILMYVRHAFTRLITYPGLKMSIKNVYVSGIHMVYFNMQSRYWHITQGQSLQEVSNKQSSLARSKVTSCHNQIEPGKRTFGSTVNATSTDPQQEEFRITCTNSGCRFIVDTGA